MHADDQLFLSHAASLLRGEWLGPLTDTTLVKGPVYPLWLAVNQLAGTRLLVSQAVLYTIACIALVWGLAPNVRQPARRTLLYLIVLFNPGTWANGPATRVTREGIYPSLSLLLVALAIGAALRLRDARRAAMIWAATAGVVYALLVMTREEGVWLVPSLAILALTPFARGRPLPWRPWLGATMAAALAFALPTAIVAAMNWKHYGLFETCETRADYFTSAYGALTRVKASSWNPHVPVPLEARASVFAVSPAFQKIAPTIERDAPAWTAAGCQALGVCDDIAGGWFMWCFRAAVARAGEYRDGQRARAWYERLTREVDEACRSGQLRCFPPRSSLMPPWRMEYLAPVTAALGRATVHVTTFFDVSPYPSLPKGDEPDLVEFERMTNEQLPRAVIELHGVVTSRAGEIVAAVVDHLGGPVPALVRRELAVPAAAPQDGGAHTIRLALTANCTADCALVLLVADGRSLLVPLTEGPMSGRNAALSWTTESATVRPLTPLDRSREVRLAVLAAVTRAYSLAVPLLSLLSVMVLAWRGIQAVRDRTARDLPIVAAALMVAVGVRLLLLAFVDATSFPAVNVLYLSPAYALLVAFVALTLVSKGVHATPSNAQQLP